MKRKIRNFLAFTLVLSILLSICPVHTVSAAKKVIKISSVTALKRISKRPSGNYTLTRNLNLRSKNWSPIGSAEAPFTGTFDGNGFTIKNIYTSEDQNYQGLFGYVAGGTIKNLTVTGTVKGNTYVGAFAGLLENGRIINCVNKAKIYGVDQVGGLVGRISGSLALNCQNNAVVTGSGRCTGGITSDLYPSGQEFNCVNLGKSTEAMTLMEASLVVPPKEKYGTA